MINLENLISGIVPYGTKNNAYKNQTTPDYSPSNDEKVEIAQKTLSSAKIKMLKETTTVELNEKNQVKSYEQQSIGTLKTEDGRTLKVTKTVKVEEESFVCTIL